jgi:hypothetical protein
MAKETFQAPHDHVPGFVEAIVAHDGDNMMACDANQKTLNAPEALRCQAIASIHSQVLLEPHEEHPGWRIRSTAVA